MKKINIVINKNWEAEPMIAAICSSQFRPASLPFPEELLTVKDGLYRADVQTIAINDNKNARAIIRFHENNDATKPVLLEVRIWCIQDFMDLKKSSSSSEEKFRFLPDLLKAENPDLIICAGTAGYISDNSIAGCVSFGSRFFVHDGHPNNPGSHMVSDLFDRLLPQTCTPDLFQIFSPAFKLNTEPKFLKTPNAPASRVSFFESQYYTALSSVNVIDYAEYAWVDNETVAAFREVEKKLPIGSLETTHGVIRLSSDAPMFFISALTDKEGDFDTEVTAGQNYVAAFNAGIVFGQFLTDLNSFLINNSMFDFQYHAQKPF